MQTIHPFVDPIFHISFVGRGAFATRKIKEGGLVTPVPLVQLPSGSIVDMHELAQSDEESEDGPIYYRLSDEVQGKQLLLNYCWGTSSATYPRHPYRTT